MNAEPAASYGQRYPLRPLSAADRAEVTRICAACSGGDDGGDYVPEVFDRWLAEPDADFSAVLAPDRTIAGFGLVRLLDNGRTGWCEGDRVRPDFRRRGVGRALLDRAAAWASARGAVRLRAAVSAHNAPSMALFAAAGFAVTGRFDRWEATPVRGGRLPRPLPVEELDPALAVVRASIPYGASSGLYWADWRAYELDADRLALHLERQEVLLAGNSIGALAIVHNFRLGAEGSPELAFLCGAPVAVTLLLRGIRTLASLRALPRVTGLVPHGAGLDGMLQHAGFARREQDTLVAQERTLAPDS